MLDRWSNLVRRARPWLRVQLCATVIGVLLLAASAALAAHRARAEARRLGAEVVRALAPVEGLPPREDVSAIELNGARFFFHTRVMDETVERVLDAAEASCRSDGADLASELAPAVKDLGARTRQWAGLDLARLLTARGGDADAGDVACWAQRSTAQSLSIGERVRRFAETEDLTQFGALRYVHAERHGKKTIVRALWSEGPLTLKNLAPTAEDGDVPGEDLAELPRPPRSQRILFARVRGTDRAVVGYGTDSSPGELLSFYDAMLPTLGWQPIELDNGGAIEPTHPARVYVGQRGYALLAITPATAPRHGNTGVTWVSFGNPPKSQSD